MLTLNMNVLLIQLEVGSLVELLILLSDIVHLWHRNEDTIYSTSQLLSRQHLLQMVFLHTSTQLCSVQYQWQVNFGMSSSSLRFKPYH